MIIQNASEYKRIKHALDYGGGCNRVHTPKDSKCNKGPDNSRLHLDQINGLCKRLFPKIIGSAFCPCGTYNPNYIRHKCRVEMSKWENKIYLNT